MWLLSQTVIASRLRARKAWRSMRDTYLLEVMGHLRALLEKLRNDWNSNLGQMV